MALQPSDYTTTDAYVAAVQALTDPAAHGDDPLMAAEHAALFDLVPRSDATHVAVRNGRWTDRRIWWNNAIPDAASKVHIPEAITVKYDANSSTSIDTLRVDGKLLWSHTQNTLLVVDTFVNSLTGTVEVGTTAKPIRADKTAEIRIAANGDIDVVWDPFLLSRGIISHGILRMCGANKSTFHKVSSSSGPLATATTLTLDEVPDGWEVGDQCVIIGTHYIHTLGSDPEWQGTEDEELVLTAISGADLTFANDALAFDHDTPRADLRAYVANYTRNVRIVAENGDTIPVRQRPHVMLMHADDVDVRYTEFWECGRTDKSVRALHRGVLGVVSGVPCSVDATAGTFNLNPNSLIPTDFIRSGFDEGRATTIEVTGSAHAGNNTTFTISVLNNQEVLTVTDNTGMVDEAETSDIVITSPEIVVAADTNVIGRYPLHLHKTGVSFDEDPAMLIGNAIWKSPGWGITQHQSYAIVEDNCSYDVLGAHFVTEFGNEIGAHRRNIAIKSEGFHHAGGTVAKAIDNVKHFDLGRTGDGWWFQGRMIDAESNVAAGCRDGFMFMHRGGPPGEPVQVPRELMDQPSALRTPERNVDKPPIQHFVDNEAIGCINGGFVIKSGPTQDFDIRSMWVRFLAWECVVGGHWQYTGHYTFEDIDLIGTFTTGSFTKYGAVFQNNSYDMVINGGTIDNFDYGGQVVHVHTSSGIDGKEDYTFIDVVFTNIAIENIEDFDAQLDTIITANDLVDGRMVFTPVADPLVWEWNAGQTVLIDATKTDSIGAQDHNHALENNEITKARMDDHVVTRGFYTDASGDKWVVWPEWVSDRATGELSQLPIPIKFSADTPASYFTGDPIDLGLIDFTTDPPVAVAGTATTRPDTSVVIDVLAFYTDPGELSLSVDGLVQPVHGRVTDEGDGTVTYTPDPGWTGDDPFKVWATNGHGNLIPATVTVNVRKEGLLLRVA